MDRANIISNIAQHFNNISIYRNVAVMSKNAMLWILAERAEAEIDYVGNPGEYASGFSPEEYIKNNIESEMKK